MEDAVFLKYWGLKEKPFENTGDPRFFYYSPIHKEAIVRLIYVIKQQKAGALLAGDYGTGKTTIANELLAEIEESDSFQSVYIKNPLMNPKELIQEIAHQLGLADDAPTIQLKRSIEEKLKEIVDAGRHTVIVVDEAHLITRKDVLEELRLMMNVQLKNRFLSTIIIMGQLELRDMINSMPQFKQRFAIFYILKHLDEMETAKYIQHRLDIAGAERKIFTDDANALIFAASNGRPRQINNICDMSLLVGYMKRAEMVDGQTIKEVVKDLGEEV